MDDETAARIAALEQHIDRLYAMLGKTGPYSTPKWPQHPTTPGPDYPPPPNPPYPSIGAPNPQLGGMAVSATVMDLVRQDKEIHAIKQYRKETGSGLKEAKQAIDKVVRDYRQGLIR
jgi:hypothetical protein